MFIILTIIIAALLSWWGANDINAMVWILLIIATIASIFCFTGSNNHGFASTRVFQQNPPIVHRMFK